MIIISTQTSQVAVFNAPKTAIIGYRGVKKFGKGGEAIPGVTAGTHLGKYSFVFYGYYINLSVTKERF